MTEDMTMIEKLLWIRQQNERSSATDDERALISKWLDEVINQLNKIDEEVLSHEEVWEDSEPEEPGHITTGNVLHDLNLTDEQIAKAKSMSDFFNKKDSE